MAKTKSKKTKKITKRGNVFYIMSPQCGWCKKADPIVKELIDEGYKITTLPSKKKGLVSYYCTEVPSGSTATIS